MYQIAERFTTMRRLKCRRAENASNMRGRKWKMLRVMKRKSSRMRHYQNLILKNFWGSDAVVTPESRDTPDSIATRKDYKRPHLFHYTSIDAAISILGSDNPCGFAFTHYQYLNDRREYLDGLKLAQDWMKKRGGAFLEAVQDEVCSYVIKHREDQSLVPYVLSFSTESDATPLWMSYTDKSKGGMAIGLDYASIEKSIAQIKNASLHGQNLSEILFAPCIYYKKKSSDDLLMFEEVLDAAFSGFAFAMNEEDHEQFVKWCAGRIFQFAALVKGDDYRFEKEWRLVIRPRSAEHTENIQFIGGKPRLQPDGLDLKSCVRRIVISPHGNCDCIRTSAELLRQKLNKNVRIVNSRSSYAGG